MSRITEGHLVRHYQGANGGRDAALLDIAQDHALWHLHRLGLFDRGLTFKGGTALRKFRAGNSGRFSTDLDIAAPDEEVAFAVLDAVDGAKIELARHALTLEPEMLAPVPLPIHTRYGFDLPKLPVIRTEEAIAEKLARYRRVPLARDLYDLQWYANAGAFDEGVVRRLWVLKVYRDIVVDGRGAKPIDPADGLSARRQAEFRSEDIGYLTKPVRVDDWLVTVRARYSFVADLTADEVRWAEGNGRHLNEVTEALASGEGV